MREHQRVAERIQTAQEHRQEVESQPEPFARNSFGFTLVVPPTRPHRFASAVTAMGPLLPVRTDADRCMPMRTELSQRNCAKSPIVAPHADPWDSP